MSLSDERVISLLNGSFVPVFTSNEDYRDGGAAPQEERALLNRIRQEGLAKGLSIGTVHAIVVSPDGKPVDSLHTVDVAKADKLVGMLRKAAESVPAGKPVVAPSPRAIACPAGAALGLNVTARYLERKGNQLVLVENAGGNWSALPGEDLICLSPEEARGFRPPANARVGTEWALPREVSDKLLVYFYPPTENNNTAKNRITESEVTCRVTESTSARKRVAVNGQLRMDHSFYHKDDDWYVDATFAGYYDVEPKSGRVTRFRMATDSAEYRNGEQQKLPFAVAVRSVN